MDSEQKKNYLSFLLRLWCVKSSTGRRWQASLENPKDGALIGFENLQRLYEFLDAQMGELDSKVNLPHLKES